MTEKIVKDALDFLCKDYGLNYAFQRFEKYPFGNWCVDMYSFYNESGCFSVYNLTQRDEVDFYYARKFSSNIDELKGKSISIESVEKDIWEKHRKTGFLKIPFFWGSNKQVFRALAEVIKAQIDKHGEFFGIKVNK